MGLIFRSALPEELEWENRAEDVALSLDAIKRCLLNMLTALDRDTPQTKNDPAIHNLAIQESTTIQESPWLWFTLPELGFPLLSDEYRKPIHPDIEEYMRRYISNDHDWEQVNDEDCWGVNYTEPTTQIRGKIETILHISFPAQNGEGFKNVRNKSHSLDDREHGCPILSQPEGTECASQRRAIYRCDFPRIAAGKSIFLHPGPPQRTPHWQYDR